MFYDDPILSGTKTLQGQIRNDRPFYDDSILSGTKTPSYNPSLFLMFYDDSILSGTKTQAGIDLPRLGFMMTQFFQVLKP